jgi:hypothetical protein
MAGWRKAQPWTGVVHVGMAHKVNSIQKKIGNERARFNKQKQFAGPLKEAVGKR